MSLTRLQRISVALGLAMAGGLVCTVSGVLLLKLASMALSPLGATPVALGSVTPLRIAYFGATSLLSLFAMGALMTSRVQPNPGAPPPDGTGRAFSGCRGPASARAAARGIELVS